MRQHLRHTAVLACAMLAAASAQADVYQWTDEQGNVHYGDRPMGAGAQERLDIRSAPTDPSAVRERSEARRQALAERREAAEEQAAGEPTPEELRAEREERQKKCSESRERLQKYLTSRRLYREGEDGERVYLDEEQMAVARARAQETVEEYCSP